MARGGDQIIPRPATWSPGHPPPWADVVDPAAGLTLDRIRDVVARRGPGAPAAVELSDAPAPAWDNESGVASAPVPGRNGRARPIRRSAVLAPFYEHDDELWVITTRRSWDLRSHRGEVSFAGGGEEPGDEGAVGTALREANEEIALDPAAVEVVGELDHLTTITGDRFIVPVVGVLRDGRPDLTPSPDEVAAIVHVRVAELYDPGVFREELWSFEAVDLHPITFFEVEGDTIWGATAAMLRQFLAVMVGIDEPVTHR